MQSGMFGPRRDEMAGDWTELHNDLLNLYSLPIAIKVFYSKRMRLAENVT
jgi:hypothetical protein